MPEDLFESLLYFPESIPANRPPPPWAAGSEEAWMEATDGVRIHGLWWPPPEHRPTLLFLHGNAQEAYSWSLVRDDLAALDCGMLLIDYHGYGKSEGKPHEQGLYRDGEAALAWLSGRGVGDADTVVFGKSLGGAVACEVARGRALAGLVLESTFTSLESVAVNLFPFARSLEVPGSVYASIDKLPEITCPLLVIHGDLDALIPVREGMELFKAANQPKELYIVERAGHNDVSMVAGAEYGARIRHWLDQHYR